MRIACPYLHWITQTRTLILILTLSPLSLYISIAKWMHHSDHSFCTDRLLWALRSANSSNSWATCRDIEHQKCTQSQTRTYTYTHDVMHDVTHARRARAVPHPNRTCSHNCYNAGLLSWRSIQHNNTTPLIRMRFSVTSVLGQWVKYVFRNFSKL